MPLDPQEPEKVAEAVALLGLRYVVLTSVARDDLPDQGSQWFVDTMQAIRRWARESSSTVSELPQSELPQPEIPQIEVLTPDFWGGISDRTEGARVQRQRIETIVAAEPACFNHNLETVERLQGKVRRGATYDRSLRVLATVKDLNPQIPTKSGLMLGHGETEAEILQTLADLRSVHCDRLTLGQYLQPSLEHLPVQRYWTPAEFEHLGEMARLMGFSQVRSGPLVRSSYHAGEI
jgi:lipoic acid synthetase